MTKAQKKNLKVFSVLALVLALSLAFLSMAHSFIKKVDTLACIQDDIGSINNAAEFSGWTDERYDDVKALEEKREKLAEEDPIFAWLCEAHFNSSKATIRNLILFVLPFISVLAVISVILSSFLILCRQINYIRRLKIIKSVENAILALFFGCKA